MKNRERHESYGRISLHRTTGNIAKPLFGTDMIHRNTIRLEIHSAEFKRAINEDYYTDKDKIIELEMSEVQFAELITGVGTSGVPCTLVYKDGHYLEECPFKNKTDTLKEELGTEIRDIAKLTKTLSTDIVDKLKNKKTLSKADKDEIIQLIGRLNRGLSSELDYILERCQEQLTNMTLQAKGEVEAYINSKVRQLGLERLKEEVPRIE